MDVEEEDVASWLDSLYANNQQQQQTTSSSKILLNHELNGNNGDLMPRGDPLMGSYTTTNSLMANNDFDL